MKLSYRGANYEYAPDHHAHGIAGHASRPAPLHLTYRGLTYQVNPTAETSAEPATYTLVYRGTAYQVSQDAQGMTTTVTRPVGLSEAKSVTTRRVASPSRPSFVDVHQANLVHNLNHRLEVAHERGDVTLIDLLEAELRQIQAWGH